MKYDAREGDRFAAGQVLAEMDTTDVEKQAREAKAALQVAETQRDQAYHPCTPADLAEAKANVTASQAAYDIATDTLERDRRCARSELYPRPPSIRIRVTRRKTMYSLKTAEAGLEDLENPDPHKLAVSDAQVEQARVAAEDAANTVAEGQLTAPFAGVVLEEIPQEGDYLLVDGLVMLVARPGALQVVADLSEQDISGIVVGQSADVQWAGQPETTWQATVARIAPAVTQSSHPKRERGPYLPEFCSYPGWSDARGNGGCDHPPDCRPPGAAGAERGDAGQRRHPHPVRGGGARHAGARSPSATPMSSIPRSCPG